MLSRSIGAIFVVLLGLARAAPAQQVSPPEGLLDVGAEVRFAVTPTDKPVGAESGLAQASISSSSSGSIVVGKAKEGIHPIRFLNGTTTVEEGFLILVRHSSGKLTVRWAKDSSPKQDSKLVAVLTKYAKALTAERIKRLSGPAIKQFAGENPVQVTSTFVVCVTPTLGSVCVVSLAKSGKDCAVEVLKLAADDMLKEKVLAKDEVALAKNAIDGTNLIINVTLAGSDFVTDLKDPEKLKRMAAACESLAGVAGAAVDTMEDPGLKFAIKSFTGMIERTCLLIKKLVP